MKYTAAESPQAKCGKHQTQLRNGRVGEYLLDIILLKADHRCKYRSRYTYP